MLKTRFFYFILFYFLKKNFNQVRKKSKKYLMQFCFSTKTITTTKQDSDCRSDSSYMLQFLKMFYLAKPLVLTCLQGQWQSCVFSVTVCIISPNTHQHVVLWKTLQLHDGRYVINLCQSECTESLKYIWQLYLWATAGTRSGGRFQSNAGSHRYTWPETTADACKDLLTIPVASGHASRTTSGL